MSDADRTIDADESQLEPLRRLIAERATDQGTGHQGTARDRDLTTEADPDTFERLRRLAANPGDPTSGAGAVFPPPTSATPMSPAPPPSPSPSPPPPPRPSLRPFEHRHLPPSRPSVPETDAVAAPRRVAPADAPAWVPPPRSMRPEPEDRTEPTAVRPWRAATILLSALLVAVVMGWILFGRGDSSNPTPGTEPSTGDPALTTPVSEPTASTVLDTTGG